MPFPLRPGTRLRQASARLGSMSAVSFSLGSLPGLVTRYARGGYSLGSWADATGNARNATQGTGGAQPAVDTTTFGSAVPFFDGVNDRLVMPSGVTTNQNNFAAFFGFYWDGPRAPAAAGCLFNLGAGTFGFWVQPTGELFFSDVSFAGAGEVVPRWGWNYGAVRSNGTRQRLDWNGVTYTGSALGSATLTGGNIGWVVADSLAANVRYAEFSLSTPDVSDALATQALTYLSAVPVVTTPARYTRDFLAFFGNSITGGASASTRALSWPGLVTAGLSNTSGGQFGWASNSTAQVQGHAEIVAPLYYSAGRTRNVAVVQEIINDLYFGASGSTAYANVVALCQYLTGQGYTVVVCDATPRQDAGTPGGYETQRAAVNASLAADFPTATAKTRVYSPTGGVAYAAYCVRLSEIANLSDPLNTTYFAADKVHWTDAGHAAAAGSSASDIAGAIALTGLT